MPQIIDFQSLDEAIKGKSRFIIGPWCHGRQAYKNDYGGREKTGPKIKWMAGFFNKYLKEKDFDFTDTVFKDKIYNLFVMERNEYYGCDVWPSKSTVLTKYYFGPDHYFSPQIPDKHGKLEYMYNPADPYPNKGGTFLGVGVGPALQNDNESRSDQLMFETAILDSPLILLGPVSATLYISSDVPSTDFIVCLQDVFPDGNIINIQEGGAKVDITEGINEINISIWATGYQLNPGHKLRAVVTSSWFPRFNRNLNTGEPVFSAKTINIAQQAVFFGKNPSSVTLPILNIRDDKFMDE
jgi:putative CocE/NonD family hydrolase